MGLRLIIRALKAS